jgi:hypothetical protein
LFSTVRLYFRDFSVFLISPAAADEESKGNWDVACSSSSRDGEFMQIVPLF